MLFPELDLIWNILILVGLALVALYILALVINIIFIFSFSKMMRRDNRGIRVGMSAKLDILKKFQEVIEGKKIKLSDDCKHSLKYLDTEDFLEAQKDEFLESRDQLNACEMELNKVISENKKLVVNDEIELLQSLLSDVNESIRASVMAYNADVQGYNYWVKFAPCRFIFKIFGLKPKKTI